jgi:membrane protein
MIGAAIAAVLLEVGKRTMGMYLQNALSLSQLYGSLGLIPLFMFWVYLMWLAILFGLQVSSTLQHLRGRRVAELERQQAESAIVDPSAAILLMRVVAERFSEGKSADPSLLSAAAGLSEPIVERLVDALVREGLLHRVADSDNAVVLGQPAEDVPLDRVLKTAHRLVQRTVDNQPTADLLESLHNAQRETGAEVNLADLLGSAPKARGR